MSLLSLKLASTHGLVRRIMASARRAWFPSGAGEIETSPMAGETDHGERHIAAMGLASLTTLEIRLHLSPADAALLTSPPAAGGRLWYAPTGNRQTAQRYQITGTRTLADLAGWIEIRATLSK